VYRRLKSGRRGETRYHKARAILLMVCVPHVTSNTVYTSELALVTTWAIDVMDCVQESRACLAISSRSACTQKAFLCTWVNKAADRSLLFRYLQREIWECYLFQARRDRAIALPAFLCT